MCLQLPRRTPPPPPPHPPTHPQRPPTHLKRSTTPRAPLTSPCLWLMLRMSITWAPTWSSRLRRAGQAAARASGEPTSCSGVGVGLGGMDGGAGRGEV